MHTRVQTHTHTRLCRRQDTVNFTYLLLLLWHSPNTTQYCWSKDIFAFFFSFFCLWQLRLILYLCRPAIWISNSYENLIHSVSGQGLRWIFPYSHCLGKVNKRTKNRKKRKKYPIGQQSIKELTVICEQIFPLTRMSIDCRKEWLKLNGKSSESSLVEWLVIISSILQFQKSIRYHLQSTILIMPRKPPNILGTILL